MHQVIDDEVTKLANEHINWFLETLRPLLFSHFVHGFKHGQESGRDDNEKHEAATDFRCNRCGRVHRSEVDAQLCCINDT